MSMYGDERLYSRLVERVDKLRQRLRRKHHQLCGLQMEGKSTFYGPVSITWPQHVSLGPDCTLNAGVHLGGRGGIRIGTRCRLSAGAFLETGYLETVGEREDGSPKRKHRHSEIVLEDDVWIGAGAKILAGVTLGSGSIVAAGAVVTKNVPPGHAARGIPAKCVPIPPPTPPTEE